MRYILVLMLVASIGVMPARAQDKHKPAACHCATATGSKEKPDRLFHFSNGMSLALCGYQDKDMGAAVFSEFTLTQCGQDTAIRFWDATRNCRVYLKADTVYVEDLRQLPVGDNFAYKRTTWTIEKLAFTGDKLQDALLINPQLPRYTPAQIAQVHERFQGAKGNMDDDKLTLAHMLFVAMLSGDTLAERYFKEMPARFGKPDGYIAEDYHELQVMLAGWEKKRR